MANLQITDLNAELMDRAIANAQARRHNSVSEISDRQAAEVNGGFSLPAKPFTVAGMRFPPIVAGMRPIAPPKFEFDLIAR